MKNWGNLECSVQSSQTVFDVQANIENSQWINVKVTPPYGDRVQKREPANTA